MNLWESIRFTIGNLICHVCVHRSDKCPVKCHIFFHRTFVVADFVCPCMKYHEVVYKIPKMV